MFENKKYVTVFGSSIPRQGEEEYEFAYELGKVFAQNGLNVCTGGFHGIMDAVSKGSVENGGRAVGVTLDIYSAIPSHFLSKEIKCTSLFERLKNLIEIGDAYVVLQGGTGTIVELALVWEYINKSMLEEKPIACHSNLWKGIVDLMENQIQKEKRKTGLVKCFESISDCSQFIVTSLVN